MYTKKTDLQDSKQYHSKIAKKLRGAAIKLAILPTVLLSGCAANVSDFIPFLKPEDTQPQSLPIAASFKVKGKTIHLEVAETEEQQDKGLMYRTSLASDRGMLFPLNPPQQVSFWMKNTLIPLDIIFIRDGQVKSVLHNVPPCKSDPCPGYGPFVPVDRVIELPAGQAAILGIQIGDDLTVQMNLQKANK
jgi:uncharacterized protein